MKFVAVIFVDVETCLAFDYAKREKLSCYGQLLSRYKGSALSATDKQFCIALKSPWSYVNFG